MSAKKVAKLTKAELEKIAVAEARRLNIPIAGIVDTNCDPDPIDFPMPGNDDAIRSIRLFARAVSNAVVEAKGLSTEGIDVPESEAGSETVAETGAEAEPVVAAEPEKKPEPEGEVAES